MVCAEPAISPAESIRAFVLFAQEEIERAIIKMGLTVDEVLVKGPALAKIMMRADEIKREPLPADLAAAMASAVSLLESGQASFEAVRNASLAYVLLRSELKSQEPTSGELLRAAGKALWAAGFVYAEIETALPRALKAASEQVSQVREVYDLEEDLRRRDAAASAESHGRRGGMKRASKFQPLDEWSRAQFLLPGTQRLPRGMQAHAVYERMPESLRKVSTSPIQYLERLFAKIRKESTFQGAAADAKPPSRTRKGG